MLANIWLVRFPIGIPLLYSQSSCAHNSGCTPSGSPKGRVLTIYQIVKVTKDKFIFDMLCKYFHEDFMVNPVKILCYVQFQHIPLFGAPGCLAKPFLKLRPCRRGSFSGSATVTMFYILPVKTMDLIFDNTPTVRHDPYIVGP